jgi:ribosomal protein S18 acetylase RimI-like enzyme
VNLVIRPYIRGQDEQVRIDIYNRAHAEDEDFFPSKLEDVLRWDQSPEEPHRRRFIAELAGVPVGVAFGNVDPHRAELKGFLAGPHVVPEHRRKGVGSALARRVFDDLRARGMTQAEAEERDRPAATGFLQSLGVKVTRIFSFMLRRLDFPPEPPRLAADTDIGLVEPTDEVLKHIVAIENEAFKEHYNHSTLKLTDLQFMVKAVAEDGTVSHVRLARVAGEPVGYLWYGFDPDVVAHLKKNRGWLWDLGVLKPHRCHGIAGAMMVAAMHDLKRDGMDEVKLRVDDTNVTGARRLYEKLGFTLAYRSLSQVVDL